MSPFHGTRCDIACRYRKDKPNQEKLGKANTSRSRREEGGKTNRKSDTTSETCFVLFSPLMENKLSFCAFISI